MQISAALFLLSFSFLFHPGLDMCERALALKEGAKRAAGTFISDGGVETASTQTYTHVHAPMEPGATAVSWFRCFSLPQMDAKVCTSELLCVVFLMLLLAFPP